MIAEEHFPPQNPCCYSNENPSRATSLLRRSQLHPVQSCLLGTSNGAERASQVSCKTALPQRVEGLFHWKPVDLRCCSFLSLVKQMHLKTSSLSAAQGCGGCHSLLPLHPSSPAWQGLPARMGSGAGREWCEAGHGSCVCKLLHPSILPATVTLFLWAATLAPTGTHPAHLPLTHGTRCCLQLLPGLLHPDTRLFLGGGNNRDRGCQV